MTTLSRLVLGSVAAATMTSALLATPASAATGPLPTSTGQTSTGQNSTRAAAGQPGADGLAVGICRIWPKLCGLHTSAAGSR